MGHSTIVKFRLSDDDLERVEKAADMHGLSPGQYAKHAVLARRLPDRQMLALMRVAEFVRTHPGASQRALLDAIKAAARAG